MAARRSIGNVFVVIGIIVIVMFVLTALLGGGGARLEYWLGMVAGAALGMVGYYMRRQP